MHGHMPDMWPTRHYANQMWLRFYYHLISPNKKCVRTSQKKCVCVHGKITVVALLSWRIGESVHTLDPSLFPHMESLSTGTFVHDSVQTRS